MSPEVWREKLEGTAAQMRAEHYEQINSASAVEDPAGDRVSDATPEGERLLTQAEVDRIVKVRIAGMPRRSELRAAQEDAERWRNRAMRNRGEVIALERQLEDAREREARR